MSRLSIYTKDEAQKTVEGLYKDVERRIQASQPGICPIDLSVSFLHQYNLQSLHWHQQKDQEMNL